MKVESSILKDFKSNWWIVLILCIGMIPEFLQGYSHYLLILLLPSVLFTTKTDIKSLGALFFGILYVFSMRYGGISMSASSFIFNLIYPFLMLKVGLYVGKKFKDTQSVIVLVILLLTCIGSTAIFLCIQDTISSGQMINVARAIVIGNEEGRAATGYGMMLSLPLACVGLVLEPTSDSIDKQIKIYLMVLGGLALFSTVHLLNRTGIAIVLASVMVVLLSKKMSIKRIIYILLVVSAVCALFYTFLKDTEFFSDAVNFYELRDQGSGSVFHLGGRDTRLEFAYHKMIGNPYGGIDGIFYNGKSTYAHNLWIDAALKGGWMCGILLIIFALNFSNTIYKVYKRNDISRFERTLLLVVSVIWMIQCMVEPVIDGLPQYFWFMMFLWGTMSERCNMAVKFRKS